MWVAGEISGTALQMEVSEDLSLRWMSSLTIITSQTWIQYLCKSEKPTYDEDSTAVNS